LDAKKPVLGCTGLVAAITGGADGIGRATAVALIEQGAAVVLLDRNEELAVNTADGLGEKASALVLDVTDEAAVAKAFADIVSVHGRLDILVNSAGLAIRKATLELDLGSWQRVVDVNMTGVFLCCKHAAIHMIAQSSGAIVNVSSIMGLSGGGLYPNISYQSTKGAVVNMTRALAVEWARKGVRVNAVAPTWVNTSFIAPLKDNPDFINAVESLTPMGRLAEPEEVAAAITFLCGPGASMITGHTLPIDGGYLAI
jgi:NAD(P)-dependent dehydrogenase (short-subunit alcohol dehydrogenase family)